VISVSLVYSRHFFESPCERLGDAAVISARASCLWLLPLRVSTVFFLPFVLTLMTSLSHVVSFLYVIFTASMRPHVSDGDGGEPFPSARWMTPFPVENTPSFLPFSLPVGGDSWV